MSQLALKDAVLILREPLGRMIRPEQIATLVLFLVSDLAAAITGTEILIDGGQTNGI